MKILAGVMVGVLLVVVFAIVWFNKSIDGIMK